MQGSIAQPFRSDLDRAQARAGYLFLLPSFALYVLFVLAPVVVTFILSFTYYDPMAGSRWVGFDNFVRFFTDDRSLQIFWNTLRFTAFAVTGKLTIVRALTAEHWSVSLDAALAEGAAEMALP